MIQETGDSTQEKGNGKPQKSGGKKIQADRCASGLESTGRGFNSYRKDNSKKKGRDETDSTVLACIMNRWRLQQSFM